MVARYHAKVPLLGGLGTLGAPRGAYGGQVPMATYIPPHLNVGHGALPALPYVLRGLWCQPVTCWPLTTAYAVGQAYPNGNVYVLGIVGVGAASGGEN